MNYLLAAKMRYYHNDNSETILSKVCDSISRNLSGCKHELLLFLFRITIIYHMPPVPVRAFFTFQ